MASIVAVNRKAPGDVAARPVEARDDTHRDRIGAEREDDRDCGRGGLSRHGGGCPPVAARKSTGERTSSRANSGSRSYCPSAQRNVIATFWPSVNPASVSPARNATRWAHGPGEAPPRNPTTGTSAAARAPRGHAAAPPSSAMNATRLIAPPGAYLRQFPPKAQRPRCDAASLQLRWSSRSFERDLELFCKGPQITSAAALTAAATAVSAWAYSLAAPLYQSAIALPVVIHTASRLRICASARSRCFARNGWPTMNGCSAIDRTRYWPRLPRTSCRTDRRSSGRSRRPCPPCCRNTGMSPISSVYGIATIGRERVFIAIGLLVVAPVGDVVDPDSAEHDRECSSVSVSAGPSQPRERFPVCCAIVSSTPVMIGARPPRASR